MAAPTPFKRPTRKTTTFTEFSKYENGRVRNLKFNVNALADFEQETGMGFAQLMQQKAVFASARAMLWAGLKHEDRRLTIEEVGELMTDYLEDTTVPHGDHSIDNILMVAIDAAVDHGALGRRQPEPVVNVREGGVDPNSHSPAMISENSQTDSGGPSGSSGPSDTPTANSESAPTNS